MRVLKKKPLKNTLQFLAYVQHCVHKAAGAPDASTQCGLPQRSYHCLGLGAVVVAIYADAGEDALLGLAPLPH